MTHPSSPQAPMTLPERLRAIRFSSNPDDYDAITIEAAAEIDALTARVAELEARHVLTEQLSDAFKAEVAKVAALKSELAAARKVEDGGSKSTRDPEPEVQADRFVHHYTNRMRHSTDGQARKLCSVLLEDAQWMADERRRLTARVAELERERTKIRRDWIKNAEELRKFAEEDAAEAEKLLANEKHAYVALRDEYDAQRAQLKEAREKALEEAARRVETIVVSGPEDDEIDHDDYRDMQIAAAIRALKDTSHD